jgi:hypothetical protein
MAQSPSTWNSGCARSQASSSARSAAASTSPKGVLSAGLAVALGLHHQVQVVIAEHHRRRGAQRLDQAQHLQRRGPAIDQVADEPDAVGGRIEADIVEQAPERVVTSLQIADCICSHSRRVYLEPSPPPKNPRRAPRQHRRPGVHHAADRRLAPALPRCLARRTGQQLQRAGAGRQPRPRRSLRLYQGQAPGRRRIAAGHPVAATADDAAAARHGDRRRHHRHHDAATASRPARALARTEARDRLRRGRRAGCRAAARRCRTP